MKNIKQEKGITLIALVITIIVLLILAGVAISSITGENGIITKAKEAKIQIEKGQIQEILDLAVIEGTMLEKNEIFEFARQELEKKGYQIKTVVDMENSSVQNINLSETEIQLKEGASKVITVTVDETLYTNRYYVEIENKYFEIIYNNGEEIKIAENGTDIDNIVKEEKQIKITGANYSTVSINQVTKEITITGGENSGTDTLIIQYGGKQVICKVIVDNVKRLISFTIVQDYESDGSDLQEYSVSCLEGMTWTELQYSEYNPYGGQWQDDDGRMARNWGKY